MLVIIAHLIAYVIGTIMDHGKKYWYDRINEMIAMCDANLGGHDSMKRSTAGFMILWDGELLSWRSN